MRDRLEVIGIHASPVSAQMVECESFGNRSDLQLIGVAVGLDLSTRLVEMELSVARSE